MKPQMAIKGKGYGHRRSVMTDRNRIVAYFEKDEKAEVQQAARLEHVSDSLFAAGAALREARRVIMEHEIRELRKKKR